MDSGISVNAPIHLTSLHRKTSAEKKKTNFLLLIVVRRQAVTTTNFPQILNTSLHLPTGLILLSKNPLLKLGFYFTLKDI